MALDEALMRRAARDGDAVFRVYSWSGPTLSLGRNQRLVTRRGVQRDPRGDRFDALGDRSKHLSIDVRGHEGDLAQWEPREEEAPGEVKSLAEARSAARKAKNWGEADRLRGELHARGWEMEDRPDGYRLKKRGA